MRFCRMNKHDVTALDQQSRPSESTFLAILSISMQNPLWTLTRWLIPASQWIPRFSSSSRINGQLSAMLLFTWRPFQIPFTNLQCTSFPYLTTMRQLGDVYRGWQVTYVSLNSSTTTSCWSLHEQQQRDLFSLISPVWLTYLYYLLSHLYKTWPVLEKTYTVRVKQRT